MRNIPRIRFVHAADLHLDSPFAGMKAVAPDNVSSALHEATFTAYENIIKLCIDEHVDALLIAGDVYDSADRSLRRYFEVGHPSADCSYSALPRR